ncbi:MAG: DEAD/DEAH box helicase [Promethearchaeota archaeon]|nr:MAG: DEAD/DEAH box helicase [Candidatus Lokiarchaeota archaeon]
MEKSTEFYNDDFLKENEIFYRQYQDNIARKCKKQNSLIVLPTGLGKTIVAILLIAKRLQKYNNKGKILILAPTRPLVSQHLASCKKYLSLDSELINSLTGRITPEKRIILFKQSKILISTPQVIKNDTMRGRYNLDSVIMLIFDEAHRTRGNYAYTFLSREYMENCSDPLILGLTASPGKDYENIQLLCDNLYIENIIFKTYEDKDVKKYVYDIDLFLEPVELPIKFLELAQVIETLFNKFLGFFIERELISPYKRYYSKMDFLRIAQDLNFSLRYGDLLNNNNFSEEISNELNFTDPKIIDIVRDKSLNIHSIFSYCSSCISLLHAKDLLETQDIKLFDSFIERIQWKAEKDNMSAKRIVMSEHFKLIKSIIDKENLLEKYHPKIIRTLNKIKEEITEFKNKKILVFTQYREMAELLKTIINNDIEDNIVAEKFIGQSTTHNERGFTQNEQIQIINDFREGKINILTATSVAEEGLDIPNVDAIIFYEPVASEIRYIQRRGRTGRHSPGRCYILMTNSTKDIPYYKVACKKEEHMNQILLEPEDLELNTDINRSEIKFNKKKECISELEIIKNYRNRKKHEKKLLAQRSTEEIIEQLDSFSKSKKCKKFKETGVTFYSDIMNINKEKLKRKITHMKGTNKKVNNEEKQERKHYLNRNAQTIVQLVETYSKDNKIHLDKLKELAEQEEITDKKFWIHFNNACYRKYLKKKGNYVLFLKEYR